MHSAMPARSGICATLLLVFGWGTIKTGTTQAAGSNERTVIENRRRRDHKRQQRIVPLKAGLPEGMG